MKNEAFIADYHNDICHHNRFVFPVFRSKNDMVPAKFHGDDDGKANDVPSYAFLVRSGFLAVPYITWNRIVAVDGDQPH
jgi:hypothetical protein